MPIKQSLPVTMPDKTLVFVEIGEQTTLNYYVIWSTRRPVIDMRIHGPAKDLDLIIVPGLLVRKGDPY